MSRGRSARISIADLNGKESSEVGVKLSKRRNLASNKNWTNKT